MKVQGHSDGRGADQHCQRRTHTQQTLTRKPNYKKHTETLQTTPTLRSLDTPEDLVTNTKME